MEARQRGRQSGKERQKAGGRGENPRSMWLGLEGIGPYETVTTF